MAEVRLIDGPFDPAAELARFNAAHQDAGGIASFLGQVRRGDAGESAVEALELKHYPPMTEPGMRTLATQAEARFALAGLLIIHRTGVLCPGDPIVLVAAAARHRRAALSAVDFAMDHLKSDSWFWKREKTASGWRWIEPRTDDYRDRERWG